MLVLILILLLLLLLLLLSLLLLFMLLQVIHSFVNLLKKLNIGGCQNTLEGEGNKLGLCNISEINDCLLLKNLKSHFFYPLRILWLLSLWIYTWLFMCNIFFHSCKKIMRLLYNVTICWQEKWENVVYNNFIYKF